MSAFEGWALHRETVRRLEEAIHFHLSESDFARALPLLELRIGQADSLPFLPLLALCLAGVRRDGEAIEACRHASRTIAELPPGERRTALEGLLGHVVARLGRFAASPKVLPSPESSSLFR